MSKIRILPEQLANRIAAGEVVERPAAVVKELLENSLDAGASRIEIEIEGSGTRLIRVIDNGCGMDEDDMLLCLERHGTSKIATGDDLDAIKSLGFRGEAIPSIGSVSKMTITSRPTNAPLGNRVVLDYGKLIKVHEIGCSRGTIFEIRNLFGNTPARRKFLRTSRTELAHIEEVVKSYSLAAAATTFILRVDGREVLHFEESASLPERLAAIMRYQGKFLEIGKAGNHGHAPHIYGYLLPPDAEIVGSGGLRLLVNGRAIRDRLIVHAIAEGLRNFLMKGKSPAGLIHLRLPPEDVDVNVHPTKQEIRLRNSQAIHQMISQTVEKAMADHQSTIQTAFFRATPNLGEKSPQPYSPASPVENVHAQKQTELVTESKRVIADSISQPRLWGEHASFPPAQKMPATKDDFVWPLPQFPAREEIHVQSITHPHDTRDTPRIQPTETPIVSSLPQTAEPVSPSQKPEPEPSPEVNNQEHGLKIVGQFANLYIFCQSADGGLLVIDQHAAHERLLFEELKHQYTSGRIASQTLLFPETVELSLSEVECVEQNGDKIKQMGFAIREFGGNSYIVSAVPAMVSHSRPGLLFRDLLAGLTNGDDKKGRSFIIDDILASMACKAAVKAGDQLHHREIDGLLTRMAKADIFSHCPHGRPVLKHFTATEIKKWFHRT
jgi:DNA mismatch repair protein MutL